MAQKHLTAGAVIFRPSSAGPRFLLIRNAKGHWDFPKGHIEPGESRMEACRREVREEAGIRGFQAISGFMARRSWSFRDNGSRVTKVCWFYLGEARGSRIRLSSEHTRGGWYAPVVALGKLQYSTQRSLLRLAIARIKGMGR